MLLALLKIVVGVTQIFISLLCVISGIQAFRSGNYSVVGRVLKG